MEYLDVVDEAENPSDGVSSVPRRMRAAYFTARRTCGSRGAGMVPSRCCCSCVPPPRSRIRDGMMSRVRDTYPRVLALSTRPCANCARSWGWRPTPRSLFRAACGGSHRRETFGGRPFVDNQVSRIFLLLAAESTRLRCASSVRNWTVCGGCVSTSASRRCGGIRYRRVSTPRSWRW